MGIREKIAERKHLKEFDHYVLEHQTAKMAIQICSVRRRPWLVNRIMVSTETYVVSYDLTKMPLKEIFESYMVVKVEADAHALVAMHKELGYCEYISGAAKQGV